MTQSSLLVRIMHIEDELPKLSNTLSAMKITDTNAYRQNYEELSMDAALRAERIACSLRSLIYAANLVPKAKLMKQAAHVQGIHITHTDHFVQISLPGLMPKRKKYKNTTYLTDPLHYALSEYIKERTIPVFKDCVICFSHVFDKSLSTSRIRDYDNMECKQLLDVVASYLLTDDGGLFCDAYHTTEFSDRDCTLITIMSKECFPKWLKQRKNNGFFISDF